MSAQGLETLQCLELTHRSLALEHVLLQGSTVTLAHLEHVLRIPTAESDVVHLIEPQFPCGNNPQYMAPELLRQEAFDGYAVDLWSTAVMLFLILLGKNDVLFDAPVPEDRKFKAICIQGDLKGALVRDRTVSISEEALDLLQGMLRADPRDRMTLADVQAHPWVTADNVAPPRPISRHPNALLGGALSV